jgi:hypothetical protein
VRPEAGDWTFFFTNGLSDSRQTLTKADRFQRFSQWFLTIPPEGISCRAQTGWWVRRIEMERSQQQFGRTLAALAAGLISIIEHHLLRGVRPRVAVVGIDMATASSDKPWHAPTLALIRSLRCLGDELVQGGTR